MTGTEGSGFPMTGADPKGLKCIHVVYSRDVLTVNTGRSRYLFEMIGFWPFVRTLFIMNRFVCSVRAV